MEPESWTVIGTGIVILIAIAASNRSLRHEFNTRLKHLEAEVRRIDGDLKRLELEMRERLARIEGLFEACASRSWSAQPTRTLGLRHAS